MSKIPLSSPVVPVVGIDVSKATLDVCVLLPDQRPLRRRVSNDQTGHAELLAFLSQIGAHKALVALEATGPYSLAVATAAFSAGHPVTIFNPRRVLDFARAKGRRNKTDRVDAALIAEFALSAPPALWQPLPEAQNTLREFTRRRDDLENLLHSELRRLETAPAVMKLKASLQRSVRFLKAELQRLEVTLNAHLKSQASLQDDIRRLEAIPGIGSKTAILLTAEIPRHFKNARSVAAWLGVIPQQWTSGTSVRRGAHISHAAPSLRAKLYFPAITAMRWDPRSKAFAARLLAAGKSKMSVIFAVLHKLIRTAFVLLKSGAEYQPNHALQPLP